MEPVLVKYGFKDWDSVLAAIGHGGLKEGQIVNKLLESYEKENRKQNRRIRRELADKQQCRHLSLQHALNDESRQKEFACAAENAGNQPNNNDHYTHP